MAKILIVDDSEALRTQLKRILVTDNHVIIEGEDGYQGIEQLKNSPDTNLVICDVNMPNMDGISMCEHIHEMSDLRHIPILMLTTEANKELKERAKAAGVVAWMIKPIGEEQIRFALKKIMERK